LQISGKYLKIFPIGSGWSSRRGGKAAGWPVRNAESRPRQHEEGTMNPLKRVLAATDLSKPARHAAERAAMVSRETDTLLDLLHVVDLTPWERLRQLMGALPAEMEQRILDAARQKLCDLGASLKQRYGVAAGIHVASGMLLRELAGMTDALAAGLLVCGATGESVVRPFVLGTTAQRVLSTTTCPVLMVRLHPHEPYRRLLVPVDFSPSSLRAIQHARSVAPRAHVVLLHAFDVPFEGLMRYASVAEDIVQQYRIAARQDALEKLRALRDEAGLSPDNTNLVVLFGDPTLRIIEQEQESDCDLIVMGKHGANVMEELLLGSVTKRVLVESQGDVLVSV
jgi:nucleotide-binding universal stress UspA family protein